MYNKQVHNVAMRIPANLHFKLKQQASLLPGVSVHSLLIRGAELALEESQQQCKEMLRQDPFVQQLIQEELQRLSEGVDS